MVGFRKPHPRIFEDIIEQLGVKAEEVCSMISSKILGCGFLKPTISDVDKKLIYDKIPKLSKRYCLI